MASSICFSNIELYETKTRLYAIGREGLLDRYRVLKFDRTLLPPSQPCFNLSLSNLSQEELGLMVSDDGIVYTQKQIFSLLKMLEEGNGSIHWIGKCFGLLGKSQRSF
ncbi:hypothetical protein HMI54_002468 [Coelomomyces lativittatus]|nr:hypothetical protein HMI56_002364 [Coelomomyces lativittatus]KAJ1509286.1 hypothetical protein HMI54_002468 [Coelomomyces lativittatus]KAJ1516969.1 hypothetical protein HMI55_000955 [Coelomomyces lativittatus]